MPRIKGDPKPHAPKRTVADERGPSIPDPLMPDQCGPTPTHPSERRDERRPGQILPPTMPDQCDPTPTAHQANCANERRPGKIPSTHERPDQAESETHGHPNRERIGEVVKAIPSTQPFRSSFSPHPSLPTTMDCKMRPKRTPRASQLRWPKHRPIIRFLMNA